MNGEEPLKQTGEEKKKKKKKNKREQNKTEQVSKNKTIRRPDGMTRGVTRDKRTRLVATRKLTRECGRGTKRARLPSSVTSSTRS